MLKRFSHKDRIPGGLADKAKPEDFDTEQLKAGLKVELEHTSDPAIAIEIAMDHLTEDADYYKKLRTIEATVNELNIIANELDNLGLSKLANEVDVTTDLLLKEPVRKTPIELSSIPDWEINGGYNNIMQILKQATPEEVDYWGRWYHHAHDHVKALAQRYNEPFEVVAAVVAVLSPGNTWANNLKAAEGILAGKNKVNAYPRQERVARDILITANTKLVSGPKVSVFYQSLLDPKYVENHLVLDGHAINIWRGSKTNLKGVSQPSLSERESMLKDYQRAALDSELPVQAVQAITWFLWKSAKN